ncbi:MAG TPA: carboxymuconolactone decarboxylase family protein [Gammaproteobacteria bacterium]|jgi:alkylhydroperoxidase family enzyme|nr:carboxymuconolactone decarboxylase family protein [Gammaproteobacteria bacterium]
MNDFRTYDINSAPSAARAELEQIKLNHGNIPNIYGVMAEAPALLKGHTALKEQFEQSTLNKQERKIVLLSLSREMGSAYDTAMHSGAAEKQSVPSDIIEAVRAGTPLKDKKLEALRSFATKLVSSRGQVSEAQIKDFLAAGYTRANILEIVLAVGAVTLTGYTNLIAQPSLDAEFAPKVWKKAS